MCPRVRQQQIGTSRVPALRSVPTRHTWDASPVIPGTMVRDGYPGDMNDPDRVPKTCVSVLSIAIRYRHAMMASCARWFTGTQWGGIAGICGHGSA